MLFRSILGSSVRPVYVVFKSSLMSAGDEFRADVRISPCPRGTNKPHEIQGRSMPTIGLAIQIAAWESLVRLRSSEPLLAETRDFFYLPSRPQPSGEMAMADVTEESDPALVSQVAYSLAMTNLSRFLMEELASIRRNPGTIFYCNSNTSCKDMTS